MRALFLVALPGLFCLACSDSTGSGSVQDIQGPSFLKVRVDGQPLSFGETDSFTQGVNGSTLLVHVFPGTLQPGDNKILGFQIGHFNGPGTYSLGLVGDPGPVSTGFYEVLSGETLEPTASFQTIVPYTGSVRITAFDTSGTVVGTFAFTAQALIGTGVVNLTEGSFRIHRQ